MLLMAEVLFPLHHTHRVCEKLAVVFTAPGLLAINFCIDSLLKAIDFQPAAYVHMWGERTKDGESLPWNLCGIISILQTA